jgi:hypothetical protein
MFKKLVIRKMPYVRLPPDYKPVPNPGLMVFGLVDTSTGIGTWDPAGINEMTLSNGNLTALSTGGATETGVRSTDPQSSGKLFASVHMDVLAGFGELNAVGIGDGLGIDFTLASGSGYLGRAGNHGIGVWDDGAVFLNGSIVANVQGYTGGDTVYLAVDLTARLLWVRTNLGNWNNSALANPATGAGGISIAALPASSYIWFDVEEGVPAPQITVNMTGTTNMPAGFSPWISQTQTALVAISDDGAAAYTPN